MIDNEITHIPVLINQIMYQIKDIKKGLWIDATFGLGGYSRSFLENTNCNVFAIDRDPDVKKYANTLIKEFKNRFEFKSAKFSDLNKFTHLKNVVGISFDLGLSNLQIKKSDRGFSFKHNGPLDMRMSKSGLKAEDFLKNVDEKTLADILFELGDERHSRKIAKAIFKAKRESNISSTFKLAEIVRKAVPGNKFKIDKATKTFQAIRMFLNDELKELNKGLIAAEKILEPNGLLVVVSFHSIEDRIVKNFFSLCSGKSKSFSKFFPEDKRSKSFEILTKKPLVPSQEEIYNNPKSRSAKLRIAIRTSSDPLHEVAA
jgi:16S rRNA (cytosine1402-N4)-methyltransferase|tara:strand:+ start:269 stop:1216 length:948 start_codon:yes stop_codon:yes gene_type:complete